MATDKESHTEDSRPSLQVEHNKLLGYYDGGEDDSELTWTEDDGIRQSKKLIPKPSTARGWIFFGLVVTVTSFLAGAIGYLLKPRCTEQECIRMTSSYCG